MRSHEEVCKIIPLVGLCRREVFGIHVVLLQAAQACQPLECNYIANIELVCW